MSLRQDAQYIIDRALAAVLPDAAVQRALQQLPDTAQRIYLIAAGKAAWQMAHAALQQLEDRVCDGLVITKYGHSKGDLPRTRIIEAGHPVPDENSVLGARAAMQMVTPLGAQDTVLFLLSGGASSLFEAPLIPLNELADITGQLLACGADITQINTVRKRLSGVKGGRFAALCAPASVYSVILSDVLGDAPDAIASGPTAPDLSTSAQAMEIVCKYGLKLSPAALGCMVQETERNLPNVQNLVTGSVKQLCQAAADAAGELGYEPLILTDKLTSPAREAGLFLATAAQYCQNRPRSVAVIAGGETVVKVTGRGKGGRNQELVLAACPGIAGMQQTAVFSLGSDGTDGPTDAAGGYVDGDSFERLKQQGIDVEQMLDNNDSYHALQACDGLLFTGPTGTNVNDLSVALIRR